MSAKATTTTLIVMLTLIGLIACRENSATDQAEPTQIAGALSPTSTAPLPSPTATIPPPTNTVSPTPLPTETATQRPSPTSSPTRPPTSTPRASLTPTIVYGVLSSVPYQAGAYQLDTPDAATWFLPLQFFLETHYRYVPQAEDETEKDGVHARQLKWATADYLHYLLEQDTQNYFANSDYPLARRFLTMVPREDLHFTPDIIGRIIEQGIIAEMNADPTFQMGLSYPQPLADFELKAHQIEVDGVEPTEWIVRIEQQNLAYGSPIVYSLIQQSADGSWQRLPHELPIDDSKSTIDLFRQHDLTGDGQTDPTFLIHRYIGGNSNIMKLITYRWHHGILAQYWVGDMNYYGLGEGQPTYEFVDIDQDGIQEVRIERTFYPGQGCPPHRTTVTAYLNQTPIGEVETEAPRPNTSSCLLNVATDQRTIEAFEAAWQVAQDDDEFSDDLKAFIILQLASRYQATAQPDTAAAMLAQLPPLRGTSNGYAAISRQAYTQYGNDVLAICRALFADWKTDNDANVSRHIAEFMFGPNPANLCPAGQLYTAIFLQYAPVTQQPEKWLTEQGIEVIDTASFDYNSDGHDDWVFIIEPDQSAMVLFTWHPNGWLIRRVDSNQHWIVGKHQLTWRLTDEPTTEYLSDTHDIEKPLLYLQYRVHNDPVGTPDGGLVPYLIGEGKNGVMHIVQKECGECEPITNMTVDDFEPQRATTVRPEWLKLYRFWGSELARHSVDLQTIQPQIEEALAALPPDGTLTNRVAALYTYLLGYLAERTDDPERAVAHYINVIERDSASPFAWLAWSRLEPIPITP